MTSTKITANPSQGHGLTQKITDQHFDMAVRGEPVPLLPAVVMLKQVGFGEKETAQGRHRFVQYELVKLEPIVERNDAAELQFMIEALKKKRTTPDGQSALPISFPGQETEEKRKALMEAIESRWDVLGKSGAEGEQHWRDDFGVGTDPEANLYGIPGDYRKASLAHLSQYAFSIGAIGSEDEQAEVPPAVFSSGPDALSEPDDDPLADGADSGEANGDGE